MSHRWVHMLNRIQDHVMDAQSELETAQLREVKEHVEAHQTTIVRRLHAAITDHAPHLLPVYEEWLRCEVAEEQIQVRSFDDEDRCSEHLIVTQATIEVDKAVVKEVRWRPTSP